MRKVIISILLSILFIVTPAFGVAGCIEPIFTVNFSMGDEYPDIKLAQGYEGVPLVQTVKNYRDLIEPLFVCSQATQDGWNVPLNKINKNITITPRWVERKFTVTFEPGAHDAILTSPVGSDKVVTSSGASIEKPTYIRTGYTLDENWGDVNFDLIREDTTITAKWIANNYKIYLENSEQEDLVFEQNANVIEEDGVYFVDVLFDSKVTLPKPTVQEDALNGKRFAGWQIKGTLTGVGDDYIYKTDGNLTVEALWLSNQYDGLIFYENVTTINNAYPTEYNVGDTISIENPTKTGYEFLGWTYPGQDQPIKPLNFTIPNTDDFISGEIKFVANWQRKTYSVRLDEVPGQIGDKFIQVGYGEKLENLPTPDIDGYEFLYWQFPNGTKVSSDYVWDIDDEDTYLQANYVRVFTIKLVLKCRVSSSEMEWATGTFVAGSYENLGLIKSETEEYTYILENVRENSILNFLPKVKPSSADCSFWGWKLVPDNKIIKNGVVINSDNFASCYQSGEIKFIAYIYPQWSDQG